MTVYRLEVREHHVLDLKCVEFAGELVYGKRQSYDAYV
jgi:hypothetical protein